MVGWLVDGLEGGCQRPELEAGTTPGGAPWGIELPQHAHFSGFNSPSRHILQQLEKSLDVSVRIGHSPSVQRTAVHSRQLDMSAYLP